MVCYNRAPGMIRPHSVTADKLSADVAANIAGSPTFDLSAEGFDRTITIQLKDISGANLAAYGHALVWISSDPLATVNTANLASASVAPGSGLAVSTITANGMWEVISTSAGIIGLRVQASGQTTKAVNVTFEGRVYTSGYIAFQP